MPYILKEDAGKLLKEDEGGLLFQSTPIAPYIDIDVVSVDNDNDGFLDDIDEAAMLAAKVNYVRRFDIDFDNDVGEDDDTWFDNTRANNPDLGTIREAIRTSTYEKLTWADDWFCYLIALTDDAATIQKFTGNDSSPTTYGWTHIHKKPYNDPDYICSDYQHDIVYTSYKALGYGCINRGNSSIHAYGIFWVGGDWTDLNNWRIVEPQTGSVFSAGGAGLYGGIYHTTLIGFWSDTYDIGGVGWIHNYYLSVSLNEGGGGTVGYNANSPTHTQLRPLKSEEDIPFPYTFDVTLGLSIVTPTTLALVLTPYAPTILLPSLVTPTTLALTLAAYAPSIVHGTIVIPTTLALVLTGYVPVLKETTTPSTLDLVLTTYVPVLKETTTPTTLALTLTGYAPSIVQSDNQIVTPTTLALVITEYTPSMEIDVVVVPSTLALILASYAPVLRETITPSTLALALSFYIPFIGLLRSLAITSTLSTDLRIISSLEGG